MPIRSAMTSRAIRPLLTALAVFALAGSGISAAQAASEPPPQPAATQPAATRPAADSAAARSATRAAPVAPAAPGNLQDHRHAKVCSKPGPDTAACLAVVDLDVAQPFAGSGSPAGYGPADLQSAYNLPPGLPASTQGTGRTVAVVAAYDAPTAAADLAIYRAQYGLPPCGPGCFTKVNQTGQAAPLPPVNTAWAQEVSLDLDMVSAACPNCNILLVEANSASLSDLGTAVNTAVSMGAVAVSNSWGASESSNSNYFDEAYFNHPGISIAVSAGDSGYGVSYPASSRYVTAVGGTTLTRQTSVRGWSEKVWGSSSSDLAGGTGSGCSASVPKPAWQRDAGCSNRSVADVAAVADPATGVAVYDSTPNNGMSGWMVFGGTSVSAPIIAGIQAMAARGSASDYPAVYPYRSPWALYDVANGANGTCSPGYLCSAIFGFDGPTGLGSPQGTTAFGPSSPPSFSDVAPSSPFYEQITWLAHNGISKGYPDGTFQPSLAVSREAMAAFMYRLKGQPYFVPPPVSPFSDVPTWHPFYKEISWLASTGVSTGYDDGTFRPSLAVNRDAMAAFMYRLAGSPDYTPADPSPFSDVPTDARFYKEISWLAFTGITSGYPDGTFGPQLAVNRDAMAAFMDRYSAKLGR